MDELESVLMEGKGGIVLKVVFDPDPYDEFLLRLETPGRQFERHYSPPRFNDLAIANCVGETLLEFKREARSLNGSVFKETMALLDRFALVESTNGGITERLNRHRRLLLGRKERGEDKPSAAPKPPVAATEEPAAAEPEPEPEAEPRLRTRKSPKRSQMLDPMDGRFDL